MLPDYYLCVRCQTNRWPECIDDERSSSKQEYIHNLLCFARAVRDSGADLLLLCVMLASSSSCSRLCVCCIGARERKGAVRLPVRPRKDKALASSLQSLGQKKNTHKRAQISSIPSPLGTAAKKEAFAFACRCLVPAATILVAFPPAPAALTMAPIHVLLLHVLVALRPPAGSQFGSVSQSRSLALFRTLMSLCGLGHLAAGRIGRSAS
jgi:hypothetical protein